MRGPVSVGRNWGWPKKGLLGAWGQLILHQCVPEQKSSKSPKNPEKLKFEIIFLGVLSIYV